MPGLARLDAPGVLRRVIIRGIERKKIFGEDVDLKQLVRYIHLNPIRAKVITDLKELSRYPYSGHSALMGHRFMQF